MTEFDWLGKNNTLGIDIWSKKYKHGNETFDEWIERVSAGNSDVAKLITEKKFLFGGRILSNRGLDKQGVKVSLSNCFSGDTEIMTRDGIRTLLELNDKEIQVLSYGKWRDAVVKCFGEQDTVKLRLSKGKSYKTVRVTKDHIWYVIDKKNTVQEVTTENLQNGMNLAGSCLKCFKTYKPSPFGVAHGFFAGDGDHTGASRKVSFCGDKQELIPYFSPDSVGGSDLVKQISGIPKAFWSNPALSETPSYLYGWLAGYFAADGSIDERGSCTISSANIDDLEFVQDVLCALGMPCENIRVQNRLSNLTNEYSDVYILTLNKWYLNESFFILSKHKERFIKMPPIRNELWHVVEIEPDIERIPVYCVVESEKNSFTLKNGILTHNCYVVEPPEDNIESIFKCASKLARTFSYGGGCGVDISNLAPRGARVSNTAKETSGAVSFMDLYSMVTGLIGQNGRRGALMISLDCHHPDIEEFVGIKSNLDRVTKANISVKITDDFMKAVLYDSPFDLVFERPETGEKIKKTINAKSFFMKLAEMNWDFAEPGCLFWDRIENWNLLSNTKEFKYAGTNPCAEEPLPPGGSCLLGSINLAEFVQNNSFNYDDFKTTIKIAVRALNEVLDEGLPLHPLKEQRDSVRDWRQIGLGIFGLADMLIKLGVKYGSLESISICDKIAKFMTNVAIRESARLAKERGAFPKCNKFEITSTPYFNQNVDKKTKEMVLEYGLRNSQLLTIAPTGTLSTMLGVSGGIEPIYANYYERKTESLHGEDVYYKVYTPIVESYINENHIDVSDLPEYFVTAQTLKWDERINMQAAWQNHIDASISSTVNVPNEFTVDEVFNLYAYAWEQGLKGVTIYRDGCKRSGILSTSSSNADEQEIDPELKRGDVVSASDGLIGLKRRLMTGCGTLHCSAFFDPNTGDLMETYISKGSTGGCLNSLTGLSRMISLAARGGLSIEKIVDQLNSCGVCPSYAMRTAMKKDTSKGSCCPIAIGNALVDMHNQIMTNVVNFTEFEADIGDKHLGLEDNPSCPECGQPIVQEGGCVICKSCGYSKCD